MNLLKPFSKTRLMLGLFLALWSIVLLFLYLCASDLFFFHLGREKWFAALVNSLFILALFGVFYGGRKDYFSKWRSVLVIFGTWLVLMWIFGLWIPLVASFCSPPWRDKLIKIPYSAATSYMWDVWAWDVGPNGDK